MFHSQTQVYILHKILLRNLTEADSAFHHAEIGLEVFPSYFCLFFFKHFIWFGVLFALYIDYSWEISDIYY